MILRVYAPTLGRAAYASMITGLPVWVSVNSRAANFIGNRMQPWLAA
jgi:hypothetical protein